MNLHQDNLQEAYDNTKNILRGSDEFDSNKPACTKRNIKQALRRGANAHKESPNDIKWSGSQAKEKR